MNVVVTGANGFLGRHVVQRFLEDSHEVKAISRKGEFSHAVGGIRAQTLVSDYSPEDLALHLRGADVLVHLAARRMSRADRPDDLASFLQPNVSITGDLVDVAIDQGLRRFVFASTIAVYPRTHRQALKEADLPNPVNAYGLSKLMAEHLIEIKCRPTGLRFSTLRFAALYGEGERETGVLMRFAGAAKSGRDLVVSGNPAREIDQLYVKDAADAILAAAKSGGPSSVLNIGGGRGHSVIEMATAVAALSEPRIGISLRDIEEGDADRQWMDITGAAAALDWRPQFSIEQGLLEMLRTQT
jgi:UDP-glucose 4-epimerase